MDGEPRELHESGEVQPASTEPPIEDLFSFTRDPVDFMSAASFPASDPPPAQCIADGGGD